MKIAASIFVLTCGYYAFTFGRSLWVDDKNKLGGFGAVLAAAISTIVPIAFMFLR